MGVHEGHRARLKERYLEQGLKGFNDLNALELLLFYAIPRRDTNELAHALLDRFGTLEDVLGATVKELQTVPGVGEHAAVLLSLIRETARRCELNRTRGITSIQSTADAGAYLLPRLRYEQDEKLLLLCLDSQKRVLDCTEVASGAINEIKISIRKIVETAVNCRASSVILAHNHPDGSARPSKEDELTTRSIVNALKLVEIPVEDHIVVAGNEYVSFAACGLLGRSFTF